MISFAKYPAQRFQVDGQPLDYRQAYAKHKHSMTMLHEPSGVSIGEPEARANPVGPPRISS